MQPTVTALVVDDDPELCAATSRVLRRAGGYEVHTAGTCAECFDRIRDSSPDVVVLAVNLPDGSGLDVCRAIKEAPHSRSVLVVMISSSRHAPDQQTEGRDAGADDYIARPVTGRELLSRIQLLVRLRDAEASLRRRDALLEATVGSLPFDFLEFDAANTIRLQNTHAEATWGPLAGLTLGDFPAPPETTRALARALQHARHGASHTTKVVVPEGSSERVFDVLTAPVKGETGTLGVLMTLVDATERHRVESELRHTRDLLAQRVGTRTAELADANRRRILAEEEAQRAREELLHADRITRLGELAASLAHELNQPLSAILTNARAGEQLLGVRDPDLVELSAVLGDVAEDAKRAGDVIRRLRALLRRKETTQAPIDLNRAIEDVLSIVHGDFRLHGIGLEHSLSSDLPPVYADRVQLQQVVLNLVLNGLDSMRTGPSTGKRVRISTASVETGHVLVQVHDDGPGIQPQHLERLFDPFFTTKSSGLGMGLVICKRIVEAHGGTLCVAPTAEDGTGACFSFKLHAAH